MDTDSRHILANYYDLIKKIDALDSQTMIEFAEHIACKAGCSDCCRHITISWVEAVAIVVALKSIPGDKASKIRRNGETATPEGPCPLLVDDLCALYAARPIICRTHGLPLLTVQDGNRTIDFCPLNFKEADTIPGSSILDLDRLNTLLDSVNRLFIANCFEEPPEKERLSIAEALLLEIDK